MLVLPRLPPTFDLPLMRSLSLGTSGTPRHVMNGEPKIFTVGGGTPRRVHSRPKAAMALGCARKKAGVTGEVEPGLSVRYMGTNENSIASHLVTRYFSTAVLVEDSIARLDNVLVGNYHDYVYPR